LKLTFLLKEKQKTLLIIFSVVVTILLSTVMYLVISQTKRMEKFLIIDEILYLNDRQYIGQSVNLIAIDLGSQIGVTDENQQVYEIKGQKPSEWICIRYDGMEAVYKELNVPYLILSRFKADKIIVKDVSKLCSLQITITEQEVINSIISDLKDDNIVNISEIQIDAKQLNVYSEKFPGLCFILYYLHDDESGNCFIYDPNLETAWIIGSALINQLR